MNRPLRQVVPSLSKLPQTRIISSLPVSIPLNMSHNDLELQRLRAENEQLKARLRLSISATEPDFGSSGDFQLCATPASHNDTSRYGAIPRSAGSGIIVPSRHRKPVSQRLQHLLICAPATSDMLTQ